MGGEYGGLWKDWTSQHPNTPTLQHLNTSALRHPNTPALWHLNTPALPHPNTSALRHPNTPALQHSSTPAFQHSSTPTPQHPNTPTLQHLNTPALRHSNTSALRHSSILVFLLSLALAACSSVPTLQESETVKSLPEAFDEPQSDSVRAQLTWWEGFNDPMLNVLVDSALARNLDLRVATARVAEVQNQYRIARSPLFPSIQATGDGTRSSIPANTGNFSSLGGGIPGFPDRFETVTYSASLGFSYELDFWGRNRHASRAALNEFFATQADRQTALIGVISETIATYFEISDLERQMAYTSEIVDLLQERNELSEDRYQRGLINSFELYAIRQAYENERAGLPLLESNLHEARGRIAIVLGSYSADTDSWFEGERVSSLNLSEVPAGIPSSLLRLRPDVFAAERRVEAAYRRISSAQAARFPSFSLTAAGGTQTSDLADIANLDAQNFSNLTGSIVAPLFQGGRLKAEVGAAEAQYTQATATYERTVLTAFKEVSASLQALRKERERFQFLVDAAGSAAASSQAQRERFERGVGDYLAFIDARVNQLRTDSALESARRALVNARLNLHRALGGGWVNGDQFTGSLVD